MSKYLNKSIIYVFLLFCIVSLSGCSKTKVAKHPEGFGSLDSTIAESSVSTGKEIETKSVDETEDEFAVKDNVFLGHISRDENAEVYNDYVEIDRSDFSEEEIADLEEIDSDTVTDVITGEMFNLSDYDSVNYMQEEARDIWKQAYESGEVSKKEIEDYINFMYEDIDKAERDKTLSEIFDNSKEVEVYEVEVVEDETYSPEELQQLVDDMREQGIPVGLGSDADFWEASDIYDYKAGDGRGLPSLMAN